MKFINFLIFLLLSSIISTKSNSTENIKDLLKENGKLILYGPFNRNGKHTSPSNMEFDGWLRSNNPSWGIRDIIQMEKFAKNNGLSLIKDIAMPANNFILIFN